MNEQRRPVPTAAATGHAVTRTTTGAPSDQDAHALFSKLYYCAKDLTDLNIARKRADCSSFEGKPEFEKAYAACLEHSLDEQNRGRAALRSMVGCPNDERATIRAYLDATKSAAQAGDVNAQLCYVAFRLVDSSGRPYYTEKDIEDYKAAAPRYVSDALNRGDWRIVALLSTQFIEPPSGLLMYLPGIGQPDTIYKMDKLLRLGATGSYASVLNYQLNAYEHPFLGRALPKEEIANDNQWAQDTYTQYFSSQEPLHDPPTICKPSE